MEDVAPKNEAVIADSYLGDGVYASFDGYHVWLDLRGQDSVTRIALEPPVLTALDRYRQDIKAAYEAQPTDTPAQRCAARRNSTMDYAKYDGITGGEWEACKVPGDPDTIHIRTTASPEAICKTLNRIDGQAIADLPLLLARCKALEEIIQRAKSSLESSINRGRGGLDDVLLMEEMEALGDSA